MVFQCSDQQLHLANSLGMMAGEKTAQVEHQYILPKSGCGVCSGLIEFSRDER